MIYYEHCKFLTRCHTSIQSLLFWLKEFAKKRYLTFILKQMVTVHLTLKHNQFLTVC